MTKVGLFTVYDSKAEYYKAPFCVRTKGEALRAWETACNDENTEMCKHPADFTLFQIGEYNELDGTVEMFKAKIDLGNAIQSKKSTLKEVKSC